MRNCKHNTKKNIKKDRFTIGTKVRNSVRCIYKKIKSLCSFANIVATATLIATVVIGMIAYSLSNYNQPIVLDREIELNDDGDNHYSVSLHTSQGKIKCAYLATYKDSEVKYVKLTNTALNNIPIDKQQINLKEIEFLDSENEDIAHNLIQMSGTKIYDIVDFSLLIQDYSNYWSIYHILIRPGIDISNIQRSYTLRAKDETNATVSDTATGTYIAPQDVLILNTFPTSERTLREELNAFYGSDIIIASFERESEHKVTHGSASIEFTSELKMSIPYTHRDPKELIDMFNTIKRDLS